MARAVRSGERRRRRGRRRGRLGGFGAKLGDEAAGGGGRHRRVPVLLTNRMNVVTKTELGVLRNHARPPVGCA